MLTVFAIMLIGVGVGVAVRRFTIFKRTNKAISLVIFLLLFLLGKEVGADERVLSNLSTLGVQALMITLGAVLGSALCAKFVYQYFFKKDER